MQKYYKTELIENFRKENKLSVIQFCRLCKISQDLYYKVINQQLKCRASSIFKIARVINVSMSDLHY